MSDDPVDGSGGRTPVDPTDRGDSANASTRTPVAKTDARPALRLDGGVVDGRSHESRDDRDEEDEAALKARVRRLEAENTRLRERYANVRSTRNTRMALGLAVVGLLAGALAFLVPDVREVLFAIAATGLFAAVLTRFLDASRHVPLDVGRGIYVELAENEARLAEQLGLSGGHVYVATDVGPRLFVPEADTYDLDAFREADGDPLVVGDSASRSGMSLRPSGRPLLDAIRDDPGDEFGDDLSTVVETLSESVTEVFELTERIDSDVDADDGRATFVASGVLYGDPTRFDHPLGSVLGCGLATGLETPVLVTVTEAEDDDTLVTCRWETDG
jgi:hypothetical protein